MDHAEEDNSRPLLDAEQEELLAETMGSETSSRSTQQLPSESRLLTPDKSLVQGIFFLLGIGILAPWNAFISAKDYFDTRLCGNADNFENNFALVYNLAGIVSLLVLIAIKTSRAKTNDSSEQASSVTEEACLPSSHLEDDPLNGRTTLTPHDSKNNSSSYWLVMIPLTIYCCAFFMQVMLVLLPSVTKGFLPLTFGSLAVTAMAGSVAQVGIVATATEFHADMAMSPYLAGMSAGGLAISVANLLAAFWEDPAAYHDAHCSEDPAVAVVVDTPQCAPYDKIDWGAAGYFFLGCMTLVLCLMGYSYIDRLQNEENQGCYDVVAAATVDESPRIGLEMLSRQRRIDESDEQRDGIMRTPVAVTTEDRSELRQVWSTVQAPVISVFLAFVVTLGLFPGWTSQLKSVHQCHGGRLANDLYTPFTFVVFNAGDFIGRILSTRVTASRIRNLSTKLLLVAMGRFIFFFVFMFCASSHNGAALPSDVYSLLVQFTFAVSSGCLISACFVHAGNLTESNSVSELLNLAVSLGLFCGSMASFPVVKILGGGA